MSKYKFILFDLDGTLIYSHPGIHAGFRYALKELGEKEPTQEQLGRCIGPSLMYSFQTYFGLSEERAALATEKYREQYSKTGVYENMPIEGALEGLKALKEAGFKLAMATSKPYVYANIIAERWGFKEYLDEIVGPGMDGSLHTKALVIAEAMKRLGADKESCLMVGDRHHDIEGARENGVDCAMLKVGYAEAGEFDKFPPDYVFEDFFDFTKFLLANK